MDVERPDPLLRIFVADLEGDAAVEVVAADGDTYFVIDPAVFNETPATEASPRRTCAYALIRQAMKAGHLHPASTA